MKAKRTLSALLTLLMLVSVLASLPLATNAADASEPLTLTYTNPAITVDVGTKIDLTKVSVQVDETTTLDAANLTWKNGSEEITSFTPDEKGVTPLTATDGTTSKAVYVVAKNADDEEFVLYENDFETDNLAADGWIVANNAGGSPSKYTVSDGELHLGATTDGQSRLILPAWLSDFGDYGIVAEASHTNIANDGRWSAILYHVSGKDYKEERHITVRAKQITETIEFSGMHDGQWEYPYVEKTGDLRISKILDMTNAYHTMDLRVFENTVEFVLDGESLIYVPDATALKNATVTNKIGYIGLLSDQGVLNVKSIKVTALTQAPEEPEAPEIKANLIDTSANRPETNITSYVSNHAYAKDDAAFNALIEAEKHPVAILLDVAEDITADQFADYLTACYDNGIIPEFRITTEAQVNALVEALGTTGVPETMVVSEDAALIKTARAKKPTVIRAAVEFKGDAWTEEERFAAYQKTVGANAQAIVLPYALATKENVAVLQNYQLAVWAYGTEVDTDVESAWLIASGANAVLSDNWTAIADAQTRIFADENSITRTPVYTAHRGYWARDPENSMAAYIKAYETGVDCLETDVYITKDGHVVILHDGTLGRTTNATGADATNSVENMTLEQIRQYYLKQGVVVTEEQVPTFEEMLEYFQDKDVKIFCELKSYNAKLPAAVAELVKKYEMEDQVVYISFAGAQIDRIKQELNTAANYLNLSAVSASESDPVAVLNGYYNMQWQALTYNATLGPSYGNINAEYIRDAGDRGMTYFTWTYETGTRATVRAMFLNGMNGLTTNDAPYLKNTVKSISAPDTAKVGVGSKLKVNVTSVTYAKATASVADAVSYIVLDNDGVLEVNEDGTITALKDGTATVMAAYQTALPDGRTNYTLYTQPITVEVGEIENLTLADDTYTLDEEHLQGVTEKTSAEALLSHIVDAENAKIYDLDGEEVTDAEAYIGTGFTIEYNGEVTTIIVTGDVLGDGEVGAGDYMLIKRHVLETFQLTDIQKLAANITPEGDTPDGDGVSAYDYMLIKRHVLGTFNINA